MIRVLAPIAILLSLSCADETYPLVPASSGRGSFTVSAERAGGAVCAPGADCDAADAGVPERNYKDVTSQAKTECKEQCDYHYNEQNCTETDKYSWYVGCYAFCEGYVDDMDPACRDEFRDWQQCDHAGIIIDPPPAGGGDAYLWGNDGCWGCVGGPTDPNAWPDLTQCHRCQIEYDRYHDCI